ncbi:alpha/beta hydrolase [Cellulophaga sp. HaHaR_3_176]|uniref:alpha/beta hydrolase n=1 Tax=Cellulophaga sp. HaHaR_3_176 TaxID=1942464 RepID=UPI001C1FFE7E|nr:alpha/beta hydrolase [Cellulophaga sp. HaHaR_3_176]QWX84978.1 alpha/beta hydrolase [Cellulophaga sp. HaHaR_3_176]
MKVLINILAILIFLVSFFEVYSQNPKSGREILPDTLVYKIVDADTLKLTFFYPEKVELNKKIPTIVFYFGGGWSGGSTTQFEDQAKYFATRGMVSVLVDYRVKSRHKATPFDAVRDAKSAIRYLRNNAKKLHIDPNKIVASGGSAGGHLAAATAIIKGLEEPNEDVSINSKANALVLYNPVIDNSKTGYGYDKVGDRYLEISPLHNIEKGAPTTLFLLGRKDPLIPVATAYVYQSKMEAVGSRCDVLIYEGQKHGFFNQWKEEGPEYFEKTTYDVDLFLQSIGYLKEKIK